MKPCNTLPAGYGQEDYVNLSDRAIRRRIDLASFLCGMLLLFGGWRWQGFDALRALLFEGFGQYYLALLGLTAALLVLRLLHQLTHALCICLCGGRPLFAWVKWQLFVGSGVYVGRAAFLFLTLAPVLLWSGGLLLWSTCAEGLGFWLSYLLFLFSFAGSLDDFYLAAQALGRRKTALYLYRGFAAGIFTEES